MSPDNSRKDDQYDVAIVGGGCSGALVAVNLIEQYKASGLFSPLSVLLIDDSDQPARGVAYSTTCGEHLLNVSAKGMSAFPSQPGHFFDWISQRLPGSVPETFAPRMLYGDYLTELLDQARDSRAGRGAASLEVMKDRVIAADVRESSAEKASVGYKSSGSANSASTHTWANCCVEVRLASGKALHANRVVLAIGNFSPDSSGFQTMLEPSARHLFHNNPWKLGDTISSQDSVLLIGTGLTMVDVILQLRASGHRGRFFAVSRHGYLPQPHLPLHRLAVEPTTTYLPAKMPDRLIDIFRLLRNQVKLNASNQPEGDWRCTMNELRLMTASIWQRLSSTERKQFLRHLRQLWEVHRHRMAPDIAEQVQALISSNVLEIIAGRIAGIKKAERRLSVRINPRGDSPERSVTVDHVVNCIGPTTNFFAISDALIVHLLASGNLVADALGLGASVDENGALINKTGAPSRRFYSVGSLRKGMLWESTAVPELREQASQLASLLLRQSQSASAESALVH